MRWVGKRRWWWWERTGGVRISLAFTERGAGRRPDLKLGGRGL